MHPMNTSIRSFLVAAACSLAVFGSASAQTAPASQGKSSGRIGFINTERILKESVLAKAAQSKLESEFAKRDKDLQDEAARIKALSAKLDKDGPVMSDSDRVSAQQQLSDLSRDFQQKQREFGEDLNARRNAMLASVLDKANKVVRDVAEQGNYDFILQDAVYANPRVDITDKVLKELDASAGK